MGRGRKFRARNHQRRSSFIVDDIPNTRLFTANGTEFKIPTPASNTKFNKGHDKLRNFRNKFKLSLIRQTFRRFWTNVWSRLWVFYAEALWIPAYRSEWGKYKTWRYVYGQRPKVKDIDDLGGESSNSIPHSVDSDRKIQRTIALQIILKDRAKKSTSLFKPHDSKGCEILRFNITGLIFETQYRTLSEFPDTLLGNPVRRLRYWDPSRNEYFIDRHRKSFEAILYYYQSRGTLIRPSDVSLSVFEDEIQFYDLGQHILYNFFHEEGIMNVDDLPKSMPKNLLKRKVWLLIEYPESSPQARFTAIFSLFVVIISTSTFCIETLPMFTINNELNQASMQDPFHLCETVCVLWFTLEYLIRLMCCPAKIPFIRDPMNIIDVLSILPYYVTVFAVETEGEEIMVRERRHNASTTLVMLRIFRLFRVFRIFKLSRHSAGLKVLGKTLRASIRELALLMFFLLMGVIIFSSLVFFVEATEGSNEFSSIPDTFWWGIVTITSLGYGDKVPQSTFGKIVGSFCAVAAVLTLALPIPIFVANFNFFYQRETHEEGRRDNTHRPHIHSCTNLPECPTLISEDSGNDRDDENGHVSDDTVKK